MEFLITQREISIHAYLKNYGILQKNKIKVRIEAHYLQKVVHLSRFKVTRVCQISSALIQLFGSHANNAFLF